MSEFKERLRQAGVTRLLWRRKAAVLRSYGVWPGDHLRYLLFDPELNNFTYDIANRGALRQWLDHNVGIGAGRFVDELDQDTVLRSELAQRLRWRPGAKFQHFGRRLGWYATVRSRKPSLVVETGIHNGLGSAAILAALARNAEEGTEGGLLSIDPREGSGWLVPRRLEGRWEVVRSTSFDALPGRLCGRTPEMFIHDSDHAVECETWELQLAADLGATTLLSDHSHVSSALESIAHERHVHYALFREQPIHWYRGGGIGLALVKGDDEYSGPQAQVS
jgi:Methyltransferase domain